MKFKLRKGNKDWKCQICEEQILKGKIHYEIFLKDYNSRPYDKKISNTRLCLNCGSMREELIGEIGLK